MLMTRLDSLADMTAYSPLLDHLAALAAGEYREVHRASIDMIQADVHNALPYCLLGRIAGDHGNHLKARELHERAVQLQPENPYYQAFFGQALTTIGHQNAAADAADAAARNFVENAYLADTIGVIYSRTGFHEQAVEFFERAVALNPGPANYHYNLAAAYQFLGRFAEAEACYKDTLQREPASHRAWSSLVGLRRAEAENNPLGELKSRFESASHDADAALHLGHAIAKTLEDLGRYEESLEWLHLAKKLKRASPNPINYPSLFSAARATAAGIVKKEQQSAGADEPIFVIGLPRTGTTLVDRILSSHPLVTSAGELNVFPGLIKEAAGTPSNHVLDSDTLAVAGELPLAAIGEAYRKTVRPRIGDSSPRFVDKMPLNFFYAALIHRALPNARIIVLRRGAMDSCLSNYRQLLTTSHSYYHYTYDLEQTAEFYRQFDGLMGWFKSQLPPDRFIEVAYESIVHEQEAQTRRLLDFCGLPWDPTCLNFHLNKAPVSTASSVQVRQPLYSGSIGRWKRYGDKLETLRDSLAELAES